MCIRDSITIERHLENSDADIGQDLDDTLEPIEGYASCDGHDATGADRFRNFEANHDPASVTPQPPSTATTWPVTADASLERR